MKRFLIALFVLACSTSAFAGWDGAVLKSIEAQPNGQVHVGVVLSDSVSGQSTFQDFIFDAAALDTASLAKAVQARVLTLNAAGTKSKALTPGASISLTPVVVPPVDPTPPTAEQTFFADLAQLRAVSLGLGAVGIDPASVPAFVTLQKKAQGEFDPAFVADSGWPR